MKDAANNSVTCSTTFTVTDNIAPIVVTCAPAQSAFANTSCQATVPNFTANVTATDNSGYPQAPVGALGVSDASTAEQALSIYGTFRVSDGYFSTRHSAGIIFWNTANSSSVVIVEGGTLNASVMRSTWTAPGKTSYIQTGGTVYLRGNETEAGEMSGVAIFNIPNPSSTFVMTGGEIIIRDCNNGTLPNGNGLYLNCDPGNFSVTGGTITFETNPVNTTSIDIYSRVNFWNLNIKRLGSTGNANVNLLYNLTVANKLTISDNATLNFNLNGSQTYSGTITGGGGFDKIGTGTNICPGYATASAVRSSAGCAPPGRVGTSPRDGYFGPGAINFDLTVATETDLTRYRRQLDQLEKLRFGLRVQT